MAARVGKRTEGGVGKRCWKGGGKEDLSCAFSFFFLFRLLRYQSRRRSFSDFIRTEPFKRCVRHRRSVIAPCAPPRVGVSWLPNSRLSLLLQNLGTHAPAVSAHRTGNGRRGNREVITRSMGFGCRSEICDALSAVSFSLLSHSLFANFRNPALLTVLVLISSVLLRSQPPPPAIPSTCSNVSHRVPVPCGCRGKQVLLPRTRIHLLR
jgi:hypothetical protein